jgi:hypothetical protein
MQICRGFCSMCLVRRELLETVIQKTMTNPSDEAIHPHCSACTAPINPRPFAASSQHPKALPNVASLRSPIHHYLPHSHQHQRHRKNCSSISDDSPRPFTSCGGSANPLLRSHAHELSVDETAVLECQNPSRIR